MAVALARSFKIWHKTNEISFWVATDNKASFPKDIKEWVNFIEIKDGELGTGFSSKLHLDKLAPSDKTLFIDSDCLIVGNLDFVFDKFNGKSVSVVGGYIADGEWFGNIKNVCVQFQVKQIPKFNGGIYYIEKGEMATQVYIKARELEPKYDKIGFVRLRNKPNDEVIMALSMALFNQNPIIDDGLIMSDPQACPGKIKVDVLNGISLLTNPKLPNKKNQRWYPFYEVKPVIVHFLGYYTTRYPYLKEEHILKLVFEKNINIKTAKFLTFFSITLPYFIIENAKNILRPLYHTIFGIRKIKQSNRN